MPPMPGCLGPGGGAGGGSTGGGAGGGSTGGGAGGGPTGGGAGGGADGQHTVEYSTKIS